MKPHMLKGGEVCEVQLSELRPEVVRTILRLVRMARERVNDRSEDKSTLSAGIVEKTLYAELGKTPKHFTQKFALYSFHSIDSA